MNYNKFYTICSVIFLVFALPAMQSACASNYNSCIQMPQYEANFNLKISETGRKVDSHLLVLRFYQAWGDGSSFGWQFPVKPPIAFLDSQVIPIANIFSYSPSASFANGAIGLGYDQYAQYYGAVLGSEGEHLSIKGTFQQVAYMSATLYTFYSNGSSEQRELIDKEMSVLPSGCNPYTEGNSSVFAYSPEYTENRLISLKEKLKTQTTFRLPSILGDNATGQINIFRLDKNNSENDIADDIAPDGCSRAYLFARKKRNQEFIILRIKVPKTFIENAYPQKTFEKYPVRYLSVGSHRIDDEVTLDFWTVNNRMLNEYVDNQGYAYVFFAPNYFTQNLALEQKVPATQPPVITWGQYKGYLLGDPDYAIILRYRVPDPSWKGSPENAKCYANEYRLSPVTKEELGEFTPELYGDTLENFLNGKIGAVNKDAAWPG